MTTIIGRDLSVPGYYWRLSGNEWEIVRFSTQEPSDPFGARVIDTVGWDIPESEREFADDVFVGPLAAPVAEPGYSGPMAG